MPKSQIDSAALLAATIAGALALTILPGQLAWLASIGGLTLLLVLFAYDQEGYRTMFQSLAFAAVAGFCATLASAIVFRLAAGHEPGTPADSELWWKWLPLVWVGVTIIVCGMDRSRMGGRETFPSESARPQIPIQRGFIPEYRQPANPAPVPVVQPPPRTYAPSPAYAAPPAEPPPPVAAASPVYAPPPAAAPTPVAGPSPAYAPPPAEPAHTPAAAPELIAASAPIPMAPRTGKETMIYVTLMGEGLNVLRSVRAEHLGRDFYRILDAMPEGETWQFDSGHVVRCKKKNLSSGKALVAIEEAPRAS